MNKYIILREPINGIAKLEIDVCEDGVFLYLHRYPDSILPGGTFSVYDEWYEKLEYAEEACENEYGIKHDDWILTS